MIDNKEQADCGCCASELDDVSYTCEDKKFVFTKREQNVLAKIREASRQARAVKERMLCAVDDRDLEEAKQEFERLRALRSELEQERIAAADERMRLLGHL